MLDRADELRQMAASQEWMPLHQAEDWIDDVCDYLRQTLGEAHVRRVQGDGTGPAAAGTAVGQARARFLSWLDSRCDALQQFVRELG